MSIGIAIILAVGFALGCAAIGFGLLAAGALKSSVQEEQNKAVMDWLKNESVDWIDNLMQAGVKAYDEMGL